MLENYSTNTFYVTLHQADMYLVKCFKLTKEGTLNIDEEKMLNQHKTFQIVEAKHTNGGWGVYEGVTICQNIFSH